tara:strand:- start:161 stop:487 length:327 start_codon:yes stop_codon:yes gene_type:complete
MQKKITSKSFGYVERPSSEVYSIKIKEGRFKGVIYSYGKVDLKENKENDQLELNFKFIIHEANNRYDTETLNDSRRFKNYISDVLKYILEEEFGQYDEHPATDIKENM